MGQQDSEDHVCPRCVQPDGGLEASSLICGSEWRDAERKMFAVRTTHLFRDSGGGEKHVN